MRRIFWFLNRYFMVPMMRLGFGPFFGNPFTGYIMVLKAVGRKSGRIRYAPVNYAIHQGNIYCVSGGRESSDWYRNVLAHPEIEVLLPSGPIFGRVEEVTRAEERKTVIRQILQNAGFAGFFEGYNPFTISDEELQKKSADLPVLRIRPLGLGNGASDPRGWAWIWVWGLMLVLLVRLIWK
jgi:deazaflavin-dependent oxidoreductase (nitroreductase family)